MEALFPHTLVEELPGLTARRAAAQQVSSNLTSVIKRRPLTLDESGSND